MKQIRAGILALIICALQIVPGTASHAQDAGAAMDLTGMGIYGMEDAVMEAAQATVSRKAKASPNSSKRGVNMTYTPSLARRRNNFAQFVASTRVKSPQAAQDLQKTFAHTDVIRSMEPEMAKIGLRINNVADAYTAWWLNAWLASRGRLDTPPRSQIARVKAQATQTLSRVPKFVTASDTLKQQVAEAYLVQAVLIGSAMEQAKNKPAQLKNIASYVRKGAKASGLDLDKMELTNSGFQLRRG